MRHHAKRSCFCCHTADLRQQAGQQRADHHSTGDRSSDTQTRRRFLQVAAASTIGVAVTGMAGPLTGQAAANGRGGGAKPTSVVVANRGSGDITVIDADTLSTTTITLPGSAEPMYANHDSRNDRVLVGDRAASTVVAFDDQTFEVLGTVPVGAGVFHQWLDVSAGAMWVVGTAASTVTVVDADNLTALETFAIPKDLIDRGGVTHDVFVDGPHAFVSVLGLDDGSGVVLQYSARTLELTGRIETGGDPHLFVRNGTLYVPAQDSGTVSSFVAATLRPIETVDIPNAHGIFVTKRNRVFVSNIAEGGTNALWSLAGGRLDAVRGAIDTSVAVPHNVAVTKSGFVYITHSGATATAVSVVNPDTGQSVVVTAGTNPFGLTVVD